MLMHLYEPRREGPFADLAGISNLVNRFLLFRDAFMHLVFFT